MARLYIEAKPGGTADLGRQILAVTAPLGSEIKKQTLYAVAKEIRRRAKIRLTTNKKNIEGLGRDRYQTRRMVDSLDDPNFYEIDVDKGIVTLYPGGDRPDFALLDKPKGEVTWIFSSPYKFSHYDYGLSGRWYTFTQTRGVQRRGIYFFSGAIDSVMESFDAIFSKVMEKFGKKDLTQ